MRVQVGALFPDFPEEDPQPALTLHFATDTKEPHTLVPVFMIHSLENPFCYKPRCVYQQQRHQKTVLLARIARAELRLQTFHNAREGGK